MVWATSPGLQLAQHYTSRHRAQHYTSRHRALHYTSRHRAQHYTSRHRALHYTSRHRAQHYTSRHRALHYTSRHRAQHYTSRHRALHYTSRHRAHGCCAGYTHTCISSSSISLSSTMSKVFKQSTGGILSRSTLNDVRCHVTTVTLPTQVM